MVKRHHKASDGKYHIGGKKYELLIGSRAQVWHRTAYKTEGGLRKENLFMNKNGRIVSLRKHKSAKREKRLVKAGYGTRKGHFGAVLTAKAKGRGRRSRRTRRKC